MQSLRAAACRNCWKQQFDNLPPSFSACSSVVLSSLFDSLQHRALSPWPVVTVSFLRVVSFVSFLVHELLLSVNPYTGSRTDVLLDHGHASHKLLQNHLFDIGSSVPSSLIACPPLDPLSRHVSHCGPWHSFLFFFISFAICRI